MDNLLSQLLGTEILLKILIFSGVALTLLLIKNKIILFFSGISEKTSTEIDDIIIKSLQKPLSYLILLLTSVLILETINNEYLLVEIFETSKLFYIIFVTLLSWSIVRFLDNYYTHESYLKNLKDDDDPVVISQTYEITIRIMKIVIIVITILILMQELGLSISELLAFGGVGGLVVGLAAKDLLSNFFGGLMIYFDRPFKVGEFIKSPDRNIEGIVERIGWRLTVVRTFSKNVLYIPNSAFSNIVVENATRMTNRRINEVIGLRYDDISKMPIIIEEVRIYLENHSSIDQTNQPVVFFKSFAASSCDFFVYAFTSTKDWREFLTIKEEILYKISDIISKNDAAIAFPTTTIEWENNNQD